MYQQDSASVFVPSMTRDSQPKEGKHPGVGRPVLLPSPVVQTCYDCWAVRAEPHESNNGCGGLSLPQLEPRRSWGTQVKTDRPTLLPTGQPVPPCAKLELTDDPVSIPLETPPPRYLLRPSQLFFSFILARWTRRSCEEAFPPSLTRSHVLGLSANR